MDKDRFDVRHEIDKAWCPGCGNYAIIKILKQALTELDKTPQETVISSGIGQAAKMPQYINLNYFNGLHGRSLPVATAIKASNPKLTVIAESGDGCTYGEGGNHFIHTIRRNPDLTNIVHNNMIYGLTKGQGSPTTMKGVKTSVQLEGYFIEPFNPTAVALAGGATFVARAFSGNVEQSIGILKKAIEHKGYALVDMLHPCVSFNKFNDFKWYKENTYYPQGHNTDDLKAALDLALNTEKLALGVLYQKETPTFEQRVGTYDEDDRPLFKRKRDLSKLKKLLESYRS